MDTFSQKIINELTSLQNETTSLLSTFSRISRRIFDTDSFFSANGNFGFDTLPSEAIPVQDRLFKTFNRVSEIISILLVNSLDKHKGEFENLRSKILSTISQNNFTLNKNVQEEVIYVSNNFEDVKKLISTLYPNSISEPILIPDTNALYANVNIESWTFNDFDKFILAITPSILRDLDRHKIEHRNESVRKKAITLINKIKEYRRRGKLSESVIIVKDKISLFTIATEPDFEKTLSWLDKSNDDDRLIGEALEIIREHGNSAVILITSDINLQNKCELADLVYLEPPE